MYYWIQKSKGWQAGREVRYSTKRRRLPAAGKPGSVWFDANSTVQYFASLFEEILFEEDNL